MDNQAELDGRNKTCLRGNVGTTVDTDRDQLDDKKETDAAGERGTTVGGCLPPMQRVIRGFRDIINN